MRVDVLTLFPEVCEPFFDGSILGRARRGGLVTIACHNLRDFTSDSHRKVDDRPFGGGPGMVLMCQPVFDGVEAVEQMDPRPATRILLTPQGERLTQALVRELSELPRLLLIAGHYEGFDERIRSGLKPREISIGDYVLSGGEAAALVLVDAVVRLVPGALGDEASATEESFGDWGAEVSEGSIKQPAATALLEYPQYTRPREYRGMTVPEVLMSGDHAKIRGWRRDEALRRTRERRPDLLATPRPDEKS
ncbi:MAG TPA: tRNA (guanosine(37)-N1)-methyltransferase TrmD [Phycisphaerae bacterium]|nr:tRNA (guanosine(37)-N1)-methyltransferase TrmD [Phycisphaerae bacterium]